MWAFLATEVMFFGGLFTAYTVYRIALPRRVRRGEPAPQRLGRRRQHGRPALTSSLTMALAVHAAQTRRHGLGRPLPAGDHGPRGRLPRDQGLGVDDRLRRAPGPGHQLRLGLCPVARGQARRDRPGPPPHAGRAATDRSSGPASRRLGDVRGRQGRDVLRPLLLHDRPARHPHDHRPRPGRHHRVPGPPRLVLGRRRDADRGDRASTGTSSTSSGCSSIPCST